MFFVTHRKNKMHGKYPSPICGGRAQVEGHRKQTIQNKIIRGCCVEWIFQTVDGRLKLINFQLKAIKILVRVVSRKFIPQPTAERQIGSPSKFFYFMAINLCKNCRINSNANILKLDVVTFANQIWLARKQKTGSNLRKRWRKISLAQEVRQNRDISKHRSKGSPTAIYTKQARIRNMSSDIWKGWL